VNKARKAFPSWAATPLSERKKLIENFGKLLKEREGEYAKVLTSEMGKPLGQAKGELAGVQPRVKFFLENVDKVLEPRLARKDDKFLEKVTHEPLGVIANISAWNYPWFVGCNVWLPALLTGNVVVYKPSEYVPVTALNVAKTFHEAGVPKDVFQTVIGKGDVGEALIDQNIDGIFFTGSYKTGQKISQRVGGRMIRTQFELGGKDPTYVSDNVDVDRAARSLADGAMYNTGQGCCSVERIYVHKNVYDAFMKIFIEEVKSYPVGDPLQESTKVSCLTQPGHPQFLKSQVEDAVKKGAKVELGGDVIKNKGNWFQPTVLTNVNHNMKVMTEESFGPVIGIQKVSSIDEAIKLMNDSEYGLTASVYSKDQSEAEKVLGKINTGTVYWNACDRVSPYVPWSGRKHSGIGSTLGIEGIQQFVQPKAWHLVK